MRKELVRAVRKQFALRLRATIPDFREIDCGPLSSHFSLYEWKAGEALTFFVALQHHRNEDSFTIEIGWSRNGRWPTNSLPASAPDDYSEDGEMHFRLGKLWAGNKDVWWEFTARVSALQATFDDFMKEPEPIGSLLPKVEPLVEDAIQHLVSDGLKYFGRVASAMAR